MKKESNLQQSMLIYYYIFEFNHKDNNPKIILWPNTIIASEEYCLYNENAQLIKYEGDYRPLNVFIHKPI